jgi:hypothetical protein
MASPPGGSPSDAAPSGAGADALPSVPREGLSPAVLRWFVEEHRGRSFTVSVDASKPELGKATLPFEELTTAQVVEGVVKPATLRAGPGGADCTYAQLLQAQVRCAHSMHAQCRALAALNG